MGHLSQYCSAEEGQGRAVQGRPGAAAPALTFPHQAPQCFQLKPFCACRAVASSDHILAGLQAETPEAEMSQQEGSTFSIQCPYTTQPENEQLKAWCRMRNARCQLVAWTLASMQYIYSDRARQGHLTIQDDNRTVSITMSDLQAEDSGIYSCVYSSNYVPLKTISLNVYKGEYYFFPHTNPHSVRGQHCCCPTPSFCLPSTPRTLSLLPSPTACPSHSACCEGAPQSPLPWGHPALPCPAQSPLPWLMAGPSPGASSGQEQDALMPTTHAQPPICSLQSYTSGSWTASPCSARTGPWATAGEEKPGADKVRLSVH